jgi:LemA protein
MGIAIAVVVAVVFVAGGLFAVFNRLVTLRNRYRNAFSQIDVQLRRRYDLIPNLVETAKKYLAHERETMEAVIAARSGAVKARGKAAANPGDAGTMAGLASADGLLGASLGKLFALSEAYPDLKASEPMNRLSDELASTENRVAFARQAFNDSVTVYNTEREKFPNNMVAGMFGFGAATLLEAAPEPAMKEAPKVSFD